MRHPTALPTLAALSLAAAPSLGAQATPAQPAASRRPAATALDAAVEASMREAWDALAKKDSARMVRYVADGGAAVDYMGIHPMTHAGIGGMIRSCDTRSWSIDGVKTRPLSPTLALTTYTATVDQTCDGKVQPTKYYVSDVVEKRGARWVSIHHQETPAQGAS